MADRHYGFSDEQSFQRVREATRRTLGTPRVGSQRTARQAVLSGGTTSIIQPGGGAFTIAEYDPVTGDIIQTFDRGLSRVGNQTTVLDLGLLWSTDGFLYATGVGGIRPTFAPDLLLKDGFLIKWDPNTGERLWDSTSHPYHPAVVNNVGSPTASSGRINRPIFEASDGAIWTAPGPQSVNDIYAAARHDPDSGAQTGEHQESGNGWELFPCPNAGSVIIAGGQPNGGTIIRTLDDTVTTTHSVSQFPHAMIEDGGGKLIHTTDTTSTIRIYDASDLSLITSGAVLEAANTFTNALAADGTTIWAITGASTAAATVQAFNYALAEQWNIAHGGGSGNNLVQALTLHDGWLYEFAQPIRRRDPADGSVAWTAAGVGGAVFGTVSRKYSHAFGSNFVVSAHSNGGAPPSGLMCVNLTDGSLRWQDNFFASGVVVTDTDRVFACGTRRGP